jgi:hypothetical protein
MDIQQAVQVEIEADMQMLLERAYDIREKAQIAWIEQRKVFYMMIKRWGKSEM